jgi:hypothetical protein
MDHELISQSGLRKEFVTSTPSPTVPFCECAAVTPWGHQACHAFRALPVTSALVVVPGRQCPPGSSQDRPCNSAYRGTLPSVPFAKRAVSRTREPGLSPTGRMQSCIRSAVYHSIKLAATDL